MSFFVLEIVFFVSLAIVVYLFMRKLPCVSDVTESQEPKAAKRRLIKAQWIDVLDKKFVDILSKWLRKTKLFIMKIDNYVTKHLETIKRKKGNESSGQSIFNELDQEEKKKEDDTEMEIKN
ncbi:MAG TPA: hypothetical protein PK367_00555 [Candidatus Paceibacterota bacterium]|nr:hypothetical protein [Candidatus Paceibacterota bacterium]